MPRLYYFTASDPNAKIHLEDTIYNGYHIVPLLKELKLDQQEINDFLIKNDNSEYVHMWGATPGDSNKSRWAKLKEGDKVLVYTEGTFIFYGTIFAKLHNKEIAEKVWGTDSSGQTWEYIYYIKDLKEVNIDKREFAAFFNYKLNFFPQGFSNISDEKLEANLLRYKTIDKLIDVLNEEFVLSVDEIEEANFQSQLDSDFSNVKIDDIPNTPQKKKGKTGKIHSTWDRKTNISKKAIKLAKFKCEVDNSHETFISDSSNQMFMEAHHLIPIKYQNEFEYNLDVVQNIISICPNCHRKVHLSKSSVKTAILEPLFEAREEQLKLMGHVITKEEFLSFYGIVTK